MLSNKLNKRKKSKSFLLLCLDKNQGDQQQQQQQHLYEDIKKMAIAFKKNCVDFNSDFGRGANQKQISSQSSLSNSDSDSQSDDSITIPNIEQNQNNICEEQQLNQSNPALLSSTNNPQTLNQIIHSHQTNILQLSSSQERNKYHSQLNTHQSRRLSPQQSYHSQLVNGAMNLNVQNPLHQNIDQAQQSQIQPDNNENSSAMQPYQTERSEVNDPLENFARFIQENYDKEEAEESQEVQEHQEERKDEEWREAWTSMAMQVNCLGVQGLGVIALSQWGLGRRGADLGQSMDTRTLLMISMSLQIQLVCQRYQSQEVEQIKQYLRNNPYQWNIAVVWLTLMVLLAIILIFTEFFILNLAIICFSNINHTIFEQLKHSEASQKLRNQNLTSISVSFIITVLLTVMNGHQMTFSYSLALDFILKFCSTNKIIQLFHELHSQSIETQNTQKGVISFKNTNRKKEFWTKFQKEIEAFKENEKARINCSVRGSQHQGQLQQQELINYQQTQHNQDLDRSQAQQDILSNDENVNELSNTEENIDEVYSMNQTMNVTGVIDRRTNESLSNLEYPHNKYQISGSLKIGSFNNGGSASKFTMANTSNNYFEFDHHILNKLNKHIMVFQVERFNSKLQQIYLANSDNEIGHNRIQQSHLDKRNDAFTQINQTQNVKIGKRALSSMNLRQKINKQIQFIDISEGFFEELPFFRQVEHIFKYKQQDERSNNLNGQSLKNQQYFGFMNNSINNNSSQDMFLLQSRDQNNFLKGLESNNSKKIDDSVLFFKNLSKISGQNNSLVNKQPESDYGVERSSSNEALGQLLQNSDKYKQNTLYRQQHPLSRLNLSDNEQIIKKQQGHQPDIESSELMKSNFNRIGNSHFRNKFLSLTQIQEEMINLKIFQPYFINHQTILEFKEQGLTLSINDIVQRHAKNTKESTRQYRFFFKVNMNDSSLVYLLNLNSSYGSKQKQNSHGCYKGPVRLIDDSSQQLMASMQNCIGDSSYIPQHLTSKDQQNSQIRNSLGENIMGQELKAAGAKVIKNNHFDVGLNLQMNQSLEEQSSSSTFSTFSVSENKNQKQLEEQITYFEFEIIYVKQLKRACHDYNNCYILNIKDITLLVKSQKQLSDAIYQEAIEGNFSHCNMTPLNFLTQSQQMIKNETMKLFIKNFKYIQRLQSQNANDSKQKTQSSMDICKFDDLIKECSSITQKIVEMSENNKQSANQLWLLNQAQIKRIQIHQNKFVSNSSVIDDVQNYVYQAFFNFEKEIHLKNLNVYIGLQDFYDMPLIADWDNFNLIIFNLIHNAVKFNYQNGDIFIIFSLKKLKRRDQILQSQQKEQSNKQTDHDISAGQSWINPKNSTQFSDENVLNIEIIDTGEGISPYRQNLLFKPFLELQQAQEFMMKPKNDNIGLGLSASKQIARQLKGDLIIKQSQQGLTVFKLKFPVKLVMNSQFVKSQNYTSQKTKNMQQSRFSQSNSQSQLLRFSLHNQNSQPNAQISNFNNSSISESQLPSTINSKMSAIVQIYGRNDRQYRQLLTNYLTYNFKRIVNLKVDYKVQSKNFLEFIDNELKKDCSQSSRGKHFMKKYSKIDKNSHGQQQFRHVSCKNQNKFSQNIFKLREADSNYSQNEPSIKSHQVANEHMSVKKIRNLMNRIEKNKISSQSLLNMKNELYSNKSSDDSVSDCSKQIINRNSKSRQSIQAPSSSQSQLRISQNNQKSHSINQLLEYSNQIDSNNKSQKEEKDGMQASNQVQDKKQNNLNQIQKVQEYDSRLGSKLRRKYSGHQNDNRSNKPRVLSQFARSQSKQIRKKLMKKQKDRVKEQIRNGKRRYSVEDRQNAESNKNNGINNHLAKVLLLVSNKRHPLVQKHQNKNQNIQKQKQEEQQPNGVNENIKLGSNQNNHQQREAIVPQINQIQKQLIKKKCFTQQELVKDKNKMKRIRARSSGNSVLGSIINDQSIYNLKRSVSGLDSLESSELQNGRKSGQRVAPQSQQQSVQKLKVKIEKALQNIIVQDIDVNDENSDVESEKGSYPLNIQLNTQQLDNVLQVAGIDIQSTFTQNQQNNQLLQNKNIIMQRVGGSLPVGKTAKSAVQNYAKRYGGDINELNCGLSSKSPLQQIQSLGQKKEPRKNLKYQKGQKKSYQKAVKFEQFEEEKQPNDHNMRDQDEFHRREQELERIIVPSKLDIDNLDNEGLSPIMEVNFSNKIDKVDSQQNCLEVQPPPFYRQQSLSCINEDSENYSQNKNSSRKKNQRSGINIGSSLQKLNQENNNQLKQQSVQRLKEQLGLQQNNSQLNADKSRPSEEESVGQNGLCDDYSSSQDSSDVNKRSCIDSAQASKSNQKLQMYDKFKKHSDQNLALKEFVVNGIDNYMVGSVSKNKMQRSKSYRQDKMISNFQEINKKHNVSKCDFSSQVSCNCKPMILIVDDNAFNLEIQTDLVKQYLNENFGLSNPSQFIQNANDGNIAVDLVKKSLLRVCKCKQRVYKLIIMDLQMIRMNGDEAARQIKQLIHEENILRKQQNPNQDVEQIQITCNIVACSANTTDYWKQQALSSGMVSIVNKPLDTYKLKNIIENWYLPHID